MSNLFKQQCFVSLNADTRIINSDTRFANVYGSQKNAENYGVDENGNPIPSSEQILDGFIAGLAVEEVVVETGPTPEELLLEAQVEADRIIAEAQAEALKIDRESKKKAEMLFERTKLEGYKEGASKLQDELIAKSDELNAKYQEKEQALWAEYEAKLDALESDMVDIMIQVFNKVFHIQFDNKRQILLQLIKDTLLGIDAGKNFVIRVADTNFKYVESHVADIKEKFGNDVTIDIVNDMSLEEDACMIETATGIYNCGIDMVMTNLEKDIRSLCR